MSEGGRDAISPGLVVVVVVVVAVVVFIVLILITLRRHEIETILKFGPVSLSKMKTSSLGVCRPSKRVLSSRIPRT